MKIYKCVLFVAILITVTGCGNKEVNNNDFYFEVKKNGKWVNYPRGILAGESSNGVASLRSGAISCFNADSTEELNLQYNATDIRYGSDSAAIKPYTKFDLRGVYYVKNDTWIVSCGIGDRTGKACIINDFKIVEQSETSLTGYFIGNLIPTDNSFTITEGKFRVPRKIFR